MNKVGSPALLRRGALPVCRLKKKRSALVMDRSTPEESMGGTGGAARGGAGLEDAGGEGEGVRAAGFGEERGDAAVDVEAALPPRPTRALSASERGRVARRR